MVDQKENDPPPSTVSTKDTKSTQNLNDGGTDTLKHPLPPLHTESQNERRGTVIDSATGISPNTPVQRPPEPTHTAPSDETESPKPPVPPRSPRRLRSFEQVDADTGSKPLSPVRTDSEHKRHGMVFDSATGISPDAPVQRYSETTDHAPLPELLPIPGLSPTPGYPRPRTSKEGIFTLPRGIINFPVPGPDHIQAAHENTLNRPTDTPPMPVIPPLDISKKRKSTATSKTAGKAPPSDTSRVKDTNEGKDILPAEEEDSPSSIYSDHEAAPGVDIPRSRGDSARFVPPQASDFTFRAEHEPAAASSSGGGNRQHVAIPPRTVSFKAKVDAELLDYAQAKLDAKKFNSVCSETGLHPAVPSPDELKSLTGEPSPNKWKGREMEQDSTRPETIPEDDDSSEAVYCKDCGATVDPIAANEPSKDPITTEIAPFSSYHENNRSNVATWLAKLKGESSDAPKARLRDKLRQRSAAKAAVRRAEKMRNDLTGGSSSSRREAFRRSSSDGRPSSAGIRPGSAGIRPGSAAVRQSTAGARPSFAGIRQSIADARQSFAGARPSLSGARQSFADARQSLSQAIRGPHRFGTRKHREHEVEEPREPRVSETRKDKKHSLRERLSVIDNLRSTFRSFRGRPEMDTPDDDSPRPAPAGNSQSFRERIDNIMSAAESSSKIPRQSSQKLRDDKAPPGKISPLFTWDIVKPEDYSRRPSLSASGSGKIPSLPENSPATRTLPRQSFSEDSEPETQTAAGTAENPSAWGRQTLNSLNAARDAFNLNYVPPPARRRASEGDALLRIRQRINTDMNDLDPYFGRPLSEYQRQPPLDGAMTPNHADAVAPTRWPQYARLPMERSSTRRAWPAQRAASATPLTRVTFPSISPPGEQEAGSPVREAFLDTSTTLQRFVELTTSLQNFSEESQNPWRTSWQDSVDLVQDEVGNEEPVNSVDGAGDENVEEEQRRPVRRSLLGYEIEDDDLYYDGDNDDEEPGLSLGGGSPTSG